MLIESNAGAGLGHDRRERGLADLKRVAPQVITVQLDEVEGVEEYALVSALMTDEIERGDAVVIAGDSFAVDDAGARAQACQRLDDQREATSEVVARTAIEPHLRASFAGNDAEAVVFDLVQPLAAGRQLIGFGWKARRDETGLQGTLQHVEQIKSRNVGRNLAAGRCVSQLVIVTGIIPDADDKSRPAAPSAGRGAYAVRALPDLCLGIVSARLGHLDP